MSKVPMDTRSAKTTKKPLSEEELETVRQGQSAEDKRLRELATVLATDREKMSKQGAELAKERERYNKERAESESTIATACSIFTTMKDELMQEIITLRQDVNNLKTAQPRSPSPPAGQRFPESPSPSLAFNDPATEGLQTPKISLREATDGVPHFTGYNIELSQFARACRRARDIIPTHYERHLTKLLVNKLSQRAYAAVEDEPCDSVMQLLDLLNGAFGSTNTISQYRGELSNIYLGNNEHVLDYISRTKELRSAILDAERRSRGELNPGTIDEIDILTARSFCDGLPLKFRLQLKPGHFVRPFEAFATAKSLAKRDELERQRHDVAARSERAQPKYSSAVIPGQDQGRPNINRNPGQYRSTNNNPSPRDRAYVPPSEGRRFETRREQDPVNKSPLNRRYDQTSTVWCRYCKNSGHEIQECRKRQFNNSRQGNFPGPSSGPDPPRAGPTPTRPVRCIEMNQEGEERPESESSE